MKKEITRDTKVVQRKELPTVMISGDIALMNAERGFITAWIQQEREY